MEFNDGIHIDGLCIDLGYNERIVVVMVVYWTKYMVPL